MTPPKRPPPRPDSLPRAVAGDEQPDRAAVRHPGLEGADQPQPPRTGTLPGMPALKPPPLPLEVAPTRRAPSPWSKTVMRPAPPSSRAVAVRSDPPPSLEPPAQAAAATRQPEALAEALRRAEAAEAKLAELARPAFPPPVSGRQGSATPVPSSVPPKGWSDPRVIRAGIALLTAMAGLGTPLGIWLSVKAAAIEAAQQRQGKRAEETAATATSAKAESSGADKRIDALEQRLAAERAYNREVLRRMGVEVPKRPGDPDPPELQTQTPLRKPGAVTPQPVLVVTTPPP